MPSAGAHASLAYTSRLRTQPQRLRLALLLPFMVLAQIVALTIVVVSALAVISSLRAGQKPRPG